MEGRINFPLSWFRFMRHRLLPSCTDDSYFHIPRGAGDTNMYVIYEHLIILEDGLVTRNTEIMLLLKGTGFIIIIDGRTNRLLLIASVVMETPWRGGMAEQVWMQSSCSSVMFIHLAVTLLRERRSLFGHVARRDTEEGIWPHPHLLTPQTRERELELCPRLDGQPQRATGWAGERAANTCPPEILILWSGSCVTSTPTHDLCTLRENRGTCMTNPWANTNRRAALSYIIILFISIILYYYLIYQHYVMLLYYIYHYCISLTLHCDSVSFGSCLIWSCYIGVWSVWLWYLSVSILCYSCSNPAITGW